MASKIDNQIAALKLEITQLAQEIDEYRVQEEIYKKRLINDKKIPESEVLEFCDAVYNCADPDVDDLNKTNDIDTISTLMKAYPDLNVVVDCIQQRATTYWDYKEKLEDLKKLENSKKTTVPEQKESSEKASTPSQSGHLYPVTLVSGWTAKLKQYNKQMDDFLDELDKMSIKVDITWLCQKIEAFCRRINKALAVVRYQIVKTLAKIYKQANAFSSFLDPIANFNPGDIFACLGWVKNVINFFLQPYLTVVQFIVDFMTYTPPLISEATQLVAKAALVPAIAVSKIDFVAKDKNGEQQAVAELYKDSIGIKFEPISIGDVMGAEPAAPTAQVSPIKEKKQNMYEQKVENTVNEAQAIWQKMVDDINKRPQSYVDTWVAWPTRRTTLISDIPFYSTDSTMITRNPITDAKTGYEVGVAIWGDKSVKKKGYYDRKFNNNTYKYYGLYNVDLLRRIIPVTQDLYIYVIAYYELLHSGATDESSLKTLEARRKYVEFLQGYSTQFPCINTCLTDLSAKVKEGSEAMKKLEELKQPTAYD